jgi:hypothetical protein
LNPFRSIIATLLAFLIASPLCCCSAKAETRSPAKSCCVEKAGGPEKKEKQKDCPCTCKVKEPREKAKDLDLPSTAAIPLLPEVQDLTWLPAPAVEYVLACRTPHTGCDPPRLLLARYSRWLN